MQKSLSCLRKTLLVQKGREETTIASISSPMDPSNKDVISWASQTVRLEMEGTALKRDMVDGKPKHRSQSEGLLGTLCRKLSFKQRGRGKDVVLSSFNSSKDDSPTDPSSSNILDAQLKKSANRAKGNHYDIIPLPSVDTISRLGCNDMESRESSGDQLLPCAVVARAQDCCDMPFPDLDPHSCAMELSLDWNLNPDMSLPQVTSSTDGDINCNGYFQYDLDVVHALIPGYSHVLECTDGSHEDTDIAELLQDDVSRSIPHNFEDQHLLISSELDYAGALNGNLEIPKDSTRSRPIFIPPDGPPSSPLVPPAARGQTRDVGSCSLLPVLDLNGCAMHDVPSGIVPPVRVARVALSLTEELKRLAKRGWYWGPITRWEAEEKLQGLPDGSFLVRDSSDERYLLSLSFRSQGRTLHTRIEHSNGRFSFYEQPDSEGQRSVVQLIELSVRDSEAGAFCYSRSRLPGAATYPVRLTAPVSRFMHVRSLQYLCRFIIRQNTRIDLIQQLPLPTKMKDYLQEKHY